MVAASRPYDVFSLLDEPLWRVLYVFHHLAEEDARKALRERLFRVDAGMMTSLAFNQPESLGDEMRKVQAAIAEQDGSIPTMSDAERLARGLAMAERIEAGKVLTDGALTS